jgi:phage shock protein PspC (stress-responsive transcriptional regulator)
MSETETAARPAVRRLERSHSDWMLAGVCGGLARYFDVHPAFYRVGFVVLTLIGGAGILLYVAAVLVIPDEGQEDSIASAALRHRRDRPLPLIGLALVAVAGLVLLSRARFWPNGDAAWILLLVAGLTILLAGRHRHGAAATAAVTSDAQDAPEAPAAPAPAPSPRRLRTLLKGLAIAVGSLLALALVLAIVFASVFHVHLGRGIGNRAYAPTALADLRTSYRLGVGDLHVDLSRLTLPVGETRVKARVDVGDLRVIVPRDATLRLRGETQLGYVNLLGQTDDGHNARGSLETDGKSKRILILDTHVGVGSVRVTRGIR